MPKREVEYFLVDNERIYNMLMREFELLGEALVEYYLSVVQKMLEQ